MGESRWRFDFMSHLWLVHDLNGTPPEPEMYAVALSGCAGFSGLMALVVVSQRHAASAPHASLSLSLMTHTQTYGTYTPGYDLPALLAEKQNTVLRFRQEAATESRPLSLFFE